MEFLSWVEHTGLSVWIREGESILAYPTIITLHSAGLAVMVGLSSVLALRVLGVAPGLPLGALERLYPAIWSGFWVNAVSGIGLIVSDPVTMLTNPLMAIKLLLIAAAVGSVVLIRRRVLRSPAAQNGDVPPGGRTLAFASLALWTAAPGQYIDNSVFWYKMLFIGLAGANVLIFYMTGLARRVDRLLPGEAAPLSVKLVAGSSLFLWFGVIYWGRMLPFLGNAF